MVAEDNLGDRILRFPKVPKILTDPQDEIEDIRRHFEGVSQHFTVRQEPHCQQRKRGCGSCCCKGCSQVKASGAENRQLCPRKNTHHLGDL